MQSFSPIHPDIPAADNSHNPDTPVLIDTIKQLRLQMAVHKAAARFLEKKVRIIEQAHDAFPITLCMMMGIGTVVKRNEEQTEKVICREIVKETWKVNFPKRGSSTTEAHSLDDFEFKDYAGSLFSAIRRAYGVSKEKYLSSLCGNLPFIDFVSNSKSGAFFFYSNDRKYMIKTHPQNEGIFLRENFLWPYFQHIANYPDTLLCHIYGMHRVTFKGKKLHFIIMTNVFRTDLNIHKRFDLKGSHYGRDASLKEKSQLCPVLKVCVLLCHY